MLYFVFLFLLGTSILYNSSTYAQDINSLLPSLNECGLLNEDYLYNGKKIAAIDEFPWIGRIGYKEKPKDPIVYRCLAVLISKRYIVTLSHCIHRFRDYEEINVLLGDWKTTSDEDCDENGRCAPLPVEYEFEEIALHPNFISNKPGSYDLAVIRLNRDVKFTDYIRPICLPPDNVSNGDFVAQHAVYTGFQLRDGPSEKIKTFAHITSLDRCKNIYPIINVPDSGLICATYTDDYIFMSGSALLNVQVENFKPKRFYLIGILSAGANRHALTFPDVFISISSVMDFIKNNIVE